MIIVTGGAGFIGSNLVKTLNDQLGRKDIIVVDDLTHGQKFHNLADCEIADYLDQAEFLSLVKTGHEFPVLDAIFHQGACSDTTQWDGRYMMENNYAYSKALLHYALDRQVPFIYASSAAVYGGSREFAVSPSNETPLNVYGYSKLLFDQLVRRILPSASSQVVGLRYFNVYGPRESHKGSMASVAYHLFQQLAQGDEITLFSGSGGYGDGRQSRDFLYVSDAVAVNLWCFAEPSVSGIFNVGTGKSRSFNELAQEVIGEKQRGKVKYIDFPEHLREAYQHFTEADLNSLRQAGYSADFISLQKGISKYIDWMNTQRA